MLAWWKSWPEKRRRAIRLFVKIVVTVGAFYLLLNHSVEAEGQRIKIYEAIAAHLGELELRTFLPFLLMATAIKMVGIASSMLRWHFLLCGQGIRFNFFHIVGSFLIGRFLGTFLPSTVGLDTYKLYDAARFSGHAVEPAAATAIEKAMGLSGVFLTFLVALPFGYHVLGDAAGLTVAVTVPLAVTTLTAMFVVLFRPGLVEWMLALLPSMGRRRIESFVARVSNAAAAYRGKAGLLATVLLLSFLVHFCTATMYFFTALAVGASGAGFWQITFASSIQIFATVVSPFTIAGEGVREIVQALLLAKHIGASHSVLSAALGFWAAEAVTLVGGVFLWTRSPSYRPRRLVLSPALRGAGDTPPDAHQQKPPVAGRYDTTACSAVAGREA